MKLSGGGREAYSKHLMIALYTEAILPASLRSMTVGVQRLTRACSFKPTQALASDFAVSTSLLLDTEGGGHT